MTIDEIEKLLSEATPGPWHIGHIDESLDRAEIESADGIIIASDCKRNDEPLICAAPTIIRQLLDVAKALKKFTVTPPVFGHVDIVIDGDSYLVLQEALKALESNNEKGSG